MTLEMTGKSSILPAFAVLLTLAALALLFFAVPPALAGGPGSVPDAPEGLAATAVHAGIVDIEWNEAADADAYEVQVMPGGTWIPLPGEGIEIAFYGAGAIVRNLPYEGRYYFSVRARNDAGASEWSAHLFVPATGPPSQWADVPEPVNAAATGAPTISGKSQVGETLTADTSGIQDANGLERVQFRYQWIASSGNIDTDIQDATDPTYMPSTNDVGKTIKVRVSFTDDAGNQEMLTSTATAAVEAPASDNTAAVTSLGICERTTQIRNAILWQLSDVSHCEDVTAEHLASVKSINPAHGISSLKSGDFAGMSGLESIKIYHTRQMTELPPGIFDDLTNLKTLIISYSSIGELPPGIFDDLENLMHLQLHATLISELPEGIFDNLGKLRELELYYCKITSLPEGVFDELDGLTSLNLIGNGLESLPDGVFDELDGLYYLALTDNSLTTLPAGVFDNLRGLNELHMYENHLTSLPDGVFDNLPNLERLLMFRNQLTTLPSGLFRNQGKLDFLQLGRNRIASLPSDTFVGTGRLRYVWLGYNQLASLPEGIFDGLGNLRDLHMENNQLETLPDGVFDDLASLQDLSLEYNRLETLPDGVFDSNSNLHRVSLTHNRLTSLPSSLPPGDTFYLRLFLKGNQLTELPDGLFESESLRLEDLDLAGNPGAPFTFTMEGEALDQGVDENGLTTARVRYKVAQAAPVKMSSDLTVTGGTASASSVSIPAGRLYSDEITVTQSVAGEPAVLSLEDNLQLFVESWFIRAAFDVAFNSYRAGDFRGVDFVAGPSLTLFSGPNAEAMGWPAITGTVQVDQTLTADLSGVADADGIDETTLAYQWIADGSDIPGATASTYTLTYAEQGKTIQVRVSFTDEALYQEMLTSPATAAVAAVPNRGATGFPAISGTARVGETLTADTSGIADADGMDDATLAYQWIANGGNADSDIDVATGATFALSGDHVEKSIKVLVSFTDDRNNEETLTSAPTAAVAYVDGPPGAPLQVNVEAGDTELQVSWQPPSHGNKAPVEQYRIQYREEGGSNQELHTAQLSLTINNLTNGVTYLVQVTAQSAAGYGTPSEDISETPLAGRSASLDAPRNFTGEAVYHRRVALDWDDVSGANRYEVQFYDSDSLVLVVLPFGDVTVAFNGSGAVVDNLPEGRFWWLQARAANGGGASEWTEVLQLLPTKEADWESEIPNSPSTGLPTIAGTARVDETLTVDTTDIADADGLTDAVFSYQWVRNDGSTDTDIQGATNATYTPSDDNIGKTIRVRVAFTDDAGNEETLTSAATTPVAASSNSPATGQPTISGAAQVGEPLTADTTGIVDADGLTNAVFSYQWARNGGTDDTDIQDATDSAYILADNDAGKTIRVRVSFTDDANNEETLTSAATAAVAASPNTPATGVPAISGTAQEESTGICDRTPQIRDAIMRELDDVDRCEDVTGEDLAGISGFSNTNLTNSGIESIQAGDFEGLVNLGLLNLSGNRISELPPGVFDEFTGELLYLALTGNEIQSLPEGIFDGLPNLNGLWLDDNNLTSLPAGVFDEQSSLFGVWLDGNELTSLPAGVFDHNPALSKVYLDNNAIVELPDGVFDRTPDLSVLSLSGNSIVTLPEGVFDGLEDLEKLYLYDNAITVLPEDVFDGLAGLEALSLSGNSIAALSQDVFDGLTGFLWWLSLAGNDLTSLPEGVFDDLDKLRTLHLDDNSLVALPEGVFDNNHRLWFLTLNDNELTSLPANFLPDRDSPIIGSCVALSGNRLEELPDDFLHVESSLPIVVQLDDNPGAPFAFTMEAELVSQGVDQDGLGAAQVRYRVLRGAPVRMEAELSVTGGAASASTVVVRPREVYSEVITVTQSVKGEPATLILGDDLGIVIEECHYWDSDGGRHAFEFSGISFKAGSPFTLFETTSNQADAVDPEPNSPATGVPAISGTAQVGETLTADVSGIADADGLTNGSYSYQWVSNDAEIAGATGDVYTLTEDDEGKTIRVRVTFTDDLGTEETLTSEPTGPVTYAEGPPAAPQHVEVDAGDQEITLSWQAPADEGKAPVLDYRIRHREDGGSYEQTTTTGLTHRIDGLTNGVAYSVEVTARNAAGYGTPVEETGVTPRAGDPAVSPDTPENLTGEAVYHRRVELDWDDVSGADSYQVQFYDWDTRAMVVLPFKEITVVFDGSSAVVDKLTGTSFWWLQVRAVNTAGASEWSRVVQILPTKESDWEEDTNNQATGAPTIDGTAQVGETLTADTSGIADPDGLDDASFSYQWLADDANIQGATDSTYTLADSEEGKAIQVKVSFTDDAANEETLTSAATAKVAAQPNSAATGAPAISGTVQVGETLTAETTGIADVDGLDDASFSYQWLADDANIQGATDSTYTLADSEESKAIQVRVSFTDDAANEETLTSAATAKVAAQPNSAATGAPAISGTVQVGETLTAETTGIADADGLDDASFSYQWLADDANIQGATDSTYTLADSEEGKAIQVRVSFTDDAANEETLTSAATAKVAAPPPLTVSLENAETTHDGTDVFTFEIRFSEELDLSYQTLKFHAFNVTGGSVEKAQRLQKEPISNIGWKITVQPDSDGDVTVVLPVTTDCADDGAICTQDGRKLSNSLNFTVAGPGG